MACLLKVFRYNFPFFFFFWNDNFPNFKCISCFANLKWVICWIFDQFWNVYWCYVTLNIYIYIYIVFKLWFKKQKKNEKKTRNPWGLRVVAGAHRPSGFQLAGRPLSQIEAGLRATGNTPWPTRGRRILSISFEMERNKSLLEGVPMWVGKPIPSFFFFLK